MTTLKEISALLGVSVTQVSRALNDHADVSEETKRRVKEAAKQLSYHPNMSARGLRTGRSGFVALVLPFIPQHPNGLYYMQAISVMSQTFAKANLQFVLHVADNREHVLSSYQRMISSGSVDGFVLHGIECGDARIDFLRRAGIPFVVHGRTGPQIDYPFFDIDNHFVGHRLTTALVKQGHRRIAFLNGMDNRTFARDRRLGYEKAHNDADLALDWSLHRGGIMTEAFGLTETIRLLGLDQPPTAFIAGNIRIAKGIYTALRAVGLSIPDDISVVAHDDAIEDEEARDLIPPLTSTYEPLSNSWEPLANNLIGALQGRPLRSLQKVVRPQFLARSSIGAARSS